MTHRRALERPREASLGGNAHRAGIVCEVGHPQRPGQVAEVLEQADVTGEGQRLLLLFGRVAGEDEVCEFARLVDRDDHPVAGAGQPARDLDRLGEHGVEVERCVDAQDGRAQRGNALAQRLVLPHRVAGICQRILPRRLARVTGRRSTRNRGASRCCGRRIGKTTAISRNRHETFSNPHTQFMDKLTFSPGGDASSWTGPPAGVPSECS